MKTNDIIIIVAVYYIVFLFSFRDSKDVKIHVFDVGQGDAVLISIDKSKVLIDGGANFEIDFKLEKLMPFWECSLSALILTHPHYDHLAGLNRVLDRCSVDKIMFNDVDYSSAEFQIFREESSSLNIRNAVAGDWFTINEVSFYILWPTEKYLDSRIENINNVSVVVLMDYGDFEAMFLGDAEKEVLSQIDLSKISYLIDGELDLLKVSHHGAKNGLEKDFIEALDPKICIISVGADNRFGHPHQEALEFYEEIGCEILRTDEAGDIIVEVKKPLRKRQSVVTEGK